MTSDEQLLADFRAQLTKRVQQRDKAWENSRRLIDGPRFADTLTRLRERVGAAGLPPAVHDSLVEALHQGGAQRAQELSASRLKIVTGLPPSKALRALCVYFEIAEPSAPRWPVPSLDSRTVSEFVRSHRTPFDLLLTADVPSLLDLGSGDLSFVAELADLYGPRIQDENRTLILHGVDRLNPRSKLGGPLHAPTDVVQKLRARQDLSFDFLSDQDMFQFDRLTDAGRLAGRYAVTTCWAPATPTFAYEPARLSQEVIVEQLRKTKGAFRQTRYHGEPALEVQHRDRTLLFPSWKFDIRGPLALLDLIARSSRLGVLGAVDSQVFWELLAQLIEDERVRPNDQPFTSSNLAAIFGDLYDRLSALSIGEALDLSSCASLRASLPRVLSGRPPGDAYSFRSVLIRRGAVFPGIPASSTARRFGDMTEETPPWMVILVPDR